MNGRHLSLSKEVQAALTRGEREAARRLIKEAVAANRWDEWDIHVAATLLKTDGIHGGMYETGKN